MREQPTILHIVGDSAFGGASVLISSLAAHANANGFDASVLATDTDFVTYLQREGVTGVEVDIVRRKVDPLWDLRGAYRLWKMLRSGRWDIVHTHTSKAGLVGRLAAWLARVDVVVHSVHGFAFHEGSSRIAYNSLVMAERIAAHWCDEVVTVSEFHRRLALSLGIGVTSCVRSIPNGVDALRIAPKEPRTVSRDRFGMSDDEFLIVAIGRIAQQKGLDVLVDAMSELVNARPNARLLIVGDGPDRSKLEQQVSRLDLSNAVTFIGYLDDVASAYSAADVVAIPSRYEGMSITLLESMATGKAIIATSVPSTVEVTKDGEGALLVPIDDARALAEGLGLMIENESIRLRIAERALSIQREEYTAERMLQAYISLYNELLEKHAESRT